MKYIVDDISYDVIINYKSIKNTYVRVDENINIVVNTNRFVSKSSIIKLLDDNYDYLKKMIDRGNRHKLRGEKFHYLGEEYDIVVDINQEFIMFLDGCIYLKNRVDLDKWINKEIKSLFKSRLEYIYSIFNEDIEFPKLKIRCMKTRWGVCNKRDKSVTLNSRLIEYSVDKLDYVIVHELSHFVHFNHSKEFWALVSKYIPNYKKIRDDLKDY